MSQSASVCPSLCLLVEGAQCCHLRDKVHGGNLYPLRYAEQLRLPPPVGSAVAGPARLPVSAIGGAELGEIFTGRAEVFMPRFSPDSGSHGGPLGGMISFNCVFIHLH